MPTRKQRKRVQKGRRHEYETVWVDSEGNELEEPPDDVLPAPRERKPQQKRQEKGSSGASRTPMAPSWRRSIRRSAILGGVMLVFFTLTSGIVPALLLALPYTALFVPFTYALDRFAYNRWLRKTAGQPKKR
ncbi:MAG: hypothetical protein QOG85_787 [Gaiellaceae bacterium]|jgi:hypothetical protein|nr:hypothetical protein [Gaiellaceae bacterium]